MGVDGRDVSRRLERRVKSKRRGAFVQGSRAIAERCGLTRHELSTRMLADLHVVTTHETENPICRLTLHGLCHVMTVERIPAVTQTKPLASARVVSRLHLRRQNLRHPRIQMGDDVEPRHIVVLGGRQHIVPTHRVPRRR
jgi:hypothetical protein